MHSLPASRQVPPGAPHCAAAGPLFPPSPAACSTCYSRKVGSRYTANKDPHTSESCPGGFVRCWCLGKRKTMCSGRGQPGGCAARGGGSQWADPRRAVGHWGASCDQLGHPVTRGAAQQLGSEVRVVWRKDEEEEGRAWQGKRSRWQREKKGGSGVVRQNRGPASAGWLGACGVWARR